MKRFSDGGELEARHNSFTSKFYFHQFAAHISKVVGALKGGIFLSVILEQDLKDFPLRIGESLRLYSYKIQRSVLSVS